MSLVARLRRAGASLVLVLIVRPAAASDALSDQTVRQIQALLAEKSARTPSQRKMDSRLLQAVRESRGQSMVAGLDLAPVPFGTDLDGRVAVDIDARAPETLDALTVAIEALGGKIVYVSWKYKTIRARIDVSTAETVAALPDVVFIRPAVRSLHGQPARPVSSAELFAARAARVRSRLSDALRRPLTGTIDSQGDRAHRADDTRNTYGFSGSGVKIGVLSDSFDATGGAAADVASGNLPGPANPLGHLTPVTVIQDFVDPASADEGRAMLQIVHDLAPGAQLFFATADVSEAGFAANIQALRNAPNNCDIIIDDVFYFDEPVFQDGLVAQAVNTVTAAGALYFSSAGNEGSLAKGTAGVFEGDFNDTGSPAFTFPGGAKSGTIHNFGTAGSPVNGDIITSAGDAYILTWSDPFGASGNDYDLFLVRANGTVKASSTNVQSGTQDPFEEIDPPLLVAGDRLVVFRKSSAAVRAFSINTLGGTLSIASTGQTHGHSAAADAFSVAATPAAGAFDGVAPVGPFPAAFNSANQVETFTSDGPRRVFYNADGTSITPGNFLFGTDGGTVRNKPDLTAADGVSTTLPDTSGLNPFYGTSAAAPHAGAIAGLLKSANPSLTPAQVRTILTTTAVDIESAGEDNLSGFGIVQAFQAMQSLSLAPQAAVNLGTVAVSEGAFSNSNGVIDPGELAKIVVTLTNSSLVSATAVQGALTTATPGVTIAQGTASFGTIGASGSATNAGTPFVVGVSSAVPCGTAIPLSLTVSFGGGPSPQVFLVTVPVGAQHGAAISGTLGSAPPTGPGFTSTHGQQTGRLARNGVASSCAAPKATPVLMAVSGLRQFDAYTFTNTATNPQCVAVTLSSPNGANILTPTYGSAGFVPAHPASNYLADAGISDSPVTYSFTVPAGQTFSTVVHDVNVVPASGSAYTLGVSLATCSAGPSCTPVSLSPPSIAGGVKGAAYSQSIGATGGSGSYLFSLSGTLPGGLSFTGNTLSGTPTATGSFPISVTATDAVGCPAGSSGYTLVIVDCPSSPLVVTAPSTVGAGSPSRVASVPSISGVVYTWSITNGTITSGQGTNQISFTAGAAGTPLTLGVSGLIGSCPAATGSANVTVTVAGAAQFYPKTPCRLVDTRNANGPLGGPAIAASGSPDRSFTLTGVCGLPAGATSLSVNLTVVAPTAAGTLDVYRGDGAPPSTTAISFAAGQTRANNALVQLAIDGSGTVKVSNTASGALHFVLDVNGFFQ